MHSGLRYNSPVQTHYRDNSNDRVATQSITRPPRSGEKINQKNPNIQIINSNDQQRYSYTSPNNTQNLQLLPQKLNQLVDIPKLNEFTPRRNQNTVKALQLKSTSIKKRIENTPNNFNDLSDAPQLKTAKNVFESPVNTAFEFMKHNNIAGERQTTNSREIRKSRNSNNRAEHVYTTQRQASNEQERTPQRQISTEMIHASQRKMHNEIISAYQNEIKHASQKQLPNEFIYESQKQIPNEFKFESQNNYQNIYANQIHTPNESHAPSLRHIPQQVVVEKPVYVDRLIEKPMYLDRIIEKPLTIEKEKIIYVDKPIYVDRVVEKPIEKEKIIYVDKPVEKIVYVDKIVYIDKPVPIEKIVYKDKIVEKLIPQIQEKIVYIDRPIEIETNSQEFAKNIEIIENQVERITQLQKDKAVLIVENNQFKKKEVVLINDLTNIKQQLNDRESINEKNNNSLSKLSEELEKLRKYIFKKNQEIEDFKNEMEGVLQTKNSTIKDHNDKMNEITSYNSNLLTEINVLKDNIAQKTKQIHQIKDDCNQKFYQKECERILDDNEKLAERYKAQTDQISAEVQNHQKLHIENKDLKQEINNNKKNKENLMSGKNALIKTINILEEDIKRKEEEAMRYNEENKALAEECVRLSGVAKEMSEFVEQAEQIISQRGNEIQNLKVDLQESVGDARLSDLQKALSKELAIKEKIIEEYELVTNEYNKLVEENEIMTKDHYEKNNVINILQEKINGFEYMK